MKGVIGTYNNNGIYSFDLDNENGKILNLKRLKKISNSKYLKFIDKYIYSIITEDNKSGVVVLNNKGEVVSKLFFETIPSCYIKVVENKYVYTSNYHEGTISKLIFENNELKLCQKYIVEEKAGCHNIIKYNNLLYVPCLNLDKIIIMDLNLVVIGNISLPEKTGPRHGVINDDDLYIITENSNELYKINLKTNTVMNKLKLSLETASKSSAIKLSNCRNYLLVAIRNENNVYKIFINTNYLKIDSIMPTLGEETRDILNILDKYLLVVNQYSGEVISISLQNSKEINRVKVPECAVIEVSEINGK